MLFLLAPFLVHSDERLDKMNIFITTAVETGGQCGVDVPCVDPKEMANKLAENAVLMLYRVAPSNVDLAHHYELKTVSFLWKKSEAIKKACETGQYDAIFSINLETTEGSGGITGAEVRDLWLRWVDCSSLEEWKEVLPVRTDISGSDVKQKMYKYLFTTFPYFHS